MNRTCFTDMTKLQHEILQLQKYKYFMDKAMSVLTSMNQSIVDISHP